jgi:3-oxoacyl-[acyl-carrier-protein] synthase II
MTGHCLGAAAAVEAVICCKAIQTGIVPPTINLTQTDLSSDLDYVAGTARRKQLRHVMSNSFAFGGHNGVCIFSRHE